MNRSSCIRIIPYEPFMPFCHHSTDMLPSRGQISIERIPNEWPLQLEALSKPQTGAKCSASASRCVPLWSGS